MRNLNLFKRAPKLPELPIYVLTGEVPENYGGVTTVALGRCNAFARLDDRAITLLTFSPKHATSIEALRDGLVADERLDSRVALRNPWSDLIRMTDEEISELWSPVSSPVPVEVTPFDGEFEVHRTAEPGQASQIDWYREDGSIAITDQRNLSTPERSPRRTISLFSRNGLVAKQWSSVTSIYQHWLNRLTRDDSMSILIAERLTASNLLTKWNPDNVVFVQSIHSNHFTGKAVESFTYPSPKAKFYQSLDSRDLVATLTEQQARDIRSSNLTATDNVAILPNWLTHEPLSRPSFRNRHAGVIVSRISTEKQIQHSLRGMKELSSNFPEITLDIFGEGSERDKLEALTVELGISSQVKFHGYASDGARKFRDYWFSLLTSRSEGQGLVLLESMAAGCIPVAYDIKYGPADIITHGVNGFLVAPNDIHALARQVEELALMNESDLIRLRKAAIRRSRDFLPKRIVRRWAAELHHAVARKKAKLPQTQGRAILRRVRVTDYAIKMRLQVPAKHSEYSWTWAKIAWIQRETGRYGRVSAKLKRTDDKLVVNAGLQLERPDRAVDFWLDIGDSVQMRRLRIKAPKPEELQQAGEYRLSATSAGNFIVELRPDERGSA